MLLRVTVTFTTLLLLVLGLPGCADRDEAIPPALAELHQRAVAGDAAAQLELGLHYVTGTGIAPDERAALRWIGQAAAQGHAAAQFELGSYSILEPHRDFERAARLLRQSALQASPRRKAAWRSCTGLARACRKTGSKPTPGSVWPPNRANGTRWMGSPASRPN